ncbi:Sec1-like family protein [Cavenderia fasciculata]|uniref:Sec1-like family protein n=1 Tax=Cavenderia fasciculata TaxID=261658 RepID=F4QB23_CACFS|nr:Sec1-like family protein [Cavenderia fasciculata]EGG14795.1 Sec1-like family protein [Cavenderia fasciculata]|eukprot:XP_004351311.1 Sec1-like family protein [Cavenderia fasciculata]
MEEPSSADQEDGGVGGYTSSMITKIKNHNNSNNGNNKYNTISHNSINPIHRTRQSLVIVGGGSPPKHFNRPIPRGDDDNYITNNSTTTTTMSNNEKRKSLPASFFKQHLNKDKDKDTTPSSESPNKSSNNLSFMFKKLNNNNNNKDININNNNNNQNNVTIPQQQQQQQLTQLPNLTNNEPLERLRESNRKGLGDVLSLVKPSPFALIIDAKTTSLLNLITDVVFLKTNGADKIYKLNNGRLDTDCQSIVYLLRPTFENINIVIGHVNQHRLDGLKKEYTIIYIPRINLKCERLLEEHLGCTITSLEYPLDLVVLDNDLLSLELPTLYSDLYLDHDKSQLSIITKSIQKLQLLYGGGGGRIPHIKGKGHYSKLVFDSLLRSNQHLTTVSKEIDTLMLIDRQVDLITPLCTPLTFEGLIDDFFSINNNEHVLENTSKKQQQQVVKKPGQQKVSYPLHSGDKIYSQLRDRNFSSLVGMNGILNMITKNLDDPQSTLDGSESLTTIKNIIRKVNAQRLEENSLSIHIALSIQIQTITSDKYFSNILVNEQRLLHNQDIHLVEEYIEECIMRKELLWRVLKLMSLYSLVKGSINTRLYNRLKMRIVQIYGCEHLITLNNLEKVGLLKEATTSSSSSMDSSPMSSTDNGNNNQSSTIFNWINEELELVKEDIDELEPKDIGFVHSGYAPLSCRLIQHAFSRKLDGWKGIESILKALPGGPTFEESYPSPSLPQQQINTNSTTTTTTTTPKTIIYFIGGVTRTEISAIRFLGHKMKRDFLIITTKIISNGNASSSLFTNLIENFNNRENP